MVYLPRFRSGFPNERQKQCTKFHIYRGTNLKQVYLRMLLEYYYLDDKEKYNLFKRVENRQQSWEMVFIWFSRNRRFVY